MRRDPRHLLGRYRERVEDRHEVDSLAREEADRLELRERIAAQWAELRATRRSMETPLEIAAGPSNIKPARVPYGVDLAAAWSWRFVVICGAGVIVLWLLKTFAVVVLPVAIALLISALVSPLVRRLHRVGLPRRLAALLVVLLGIGVIALLVTFVSAQVTNGIGDLSGQVADGLGKIRTWLQTGPLHASDSQINDALGEAQKQVAERGRAAVGQISEVSTAVGHIVAGFFIVLFATYFFLADGPLIWAWVVRLFPRAGRRHADSSGRVAWTSLTQFVRATVLVAATDGLGVAIGALVLGVPFAGAIAVLVFLGAFVPMIGATVSGAVAVLVALVAKGPVTALLMLAVVIVVQQVEAHILQPFLMGRFVSVHPLGVILAIAMGVIVAGIPGALVAVPLAASINAVVQHLANYTEVGEDVESAAEDDPTTPDPDDAPPVEEIVDVDDAPARSTD